MLVSTAVTSTYIAENAHVFDQAADPGGDRDRRPVSRVIGADRVHPFDAQPEEFQLGVERQFTLPDATAGLLVALQPLRALGAPPHRLPVISAAHIDSAYSG